MAVVAAKYFQNHQARALADDAPGALPVRGAQRVALQPPPARPARLARGCSLETLGALFAHGRSLPDRQHAGAGLQARPRPPLPQGARQGLLRLLRGQAGEVLRLAAAPGLHHRRRAGGLRPAPRRAARPDPDPRADLRLARRRRPSTATRATTRRPTRRRSWPTPGVRLVPIRKANMRPNAGPTSWPCAAYRKRIETLYSQLEAMGLQRLRARTNPGLELKVHAALLAATIANAD